MRTHRLEKRARTGLAPMSYPPKRYVLQFVEVCCSALNGISARVLSSLEVCVALCCSVVCVAVCCTGLASMSCSPKRYVLQHVAVRCSVLQHVARDQRPCLTLPRGKCCSVLQYGAMCCRVLPGVALDSRPYPLLPRGMCCSEVQCVAALPGTSAHVLWSREELYVQCDAVCCSVVECGIVRCSALEERHICGLSSQEVCECVAIVVMCCSVLQCVTMCSTMLQCVAMFCSVLQSVVLCCSIAVSYISQEVWKCLL